MDGINLVILCGLMILVGIGIGICIVVAILLRSFRGKQATELEPEPEEDPCLECLRWGECNGVDDGCPRRKDNGR